MKEDMLFVKEQGSSYINEKGMEISKEIAIRLSDPKFVYESVHTADNVMTDTEFFPWGGVSLSHGYPGNIHLLSLWRTIDRSGNWNQAIHSNLVEIQSYLARHGTQDISLYSGWAGIASAVFAASNHGEFYNQFLNQIHRWMSPVVERWLRESTELLHQKNGVPVELYDTISGASGIGRYLLKNATDPIIVPLIEPILRFLVELTEPICADGKIVPGWFTPIKFDSSAGNKRNFPVGSFNCGMAHGIPGPLALLSVAYNNGIEVSGQYRAIEYITEWLLDSQLEDEWGCYWPHIIPFEELMTDNKLLRQREAWCYGTPGVASALYLSSISLNNPTLAQTALQSFINAVSYECERNRMDSPSLCHGLSGLLLMCLRMGSSTKDPGIEPLIDQLMAGLLQRFDSSSPLGYKDAEPGTANRMRWLTKAGLLEGAAGIAATLLDVGKAEPSDWDYLLMLS
ncbi:lanthionine synthetase C family protein [Paenibacillus sp. FSL W8-0919]|uniref:lanthionine synthetase C family protein n=1 Tax=Paenibacillus sp. FSL W8-0919 TaxID=2954707 RepID=UPI0030FC10FD